MKPLFERLATPTLARCQAVFTERGGQYGDTWKDCQFLVLRAVLSEIGVELDDNDCRAIALASLVDIKHQRFMGGWKEDNIDDGINYAAALAEQMRIIKHEQIAANQDLPGQIQNSANFDAGPNDLQG